MEIVDKIKNLFSKKSVSTDSDWLWINIFDENSSRDLHKLSKSDYLNFYKGRCFVAVSTIANAVAQLDRQVVDAKWNQINDPMSALITYDLLVNIVSYLKLNGACYIRKNKVWNKIVSLHVLRPDLITPILNDQWTDLDHYEYNVNWKKKPFAKEEIISIANFNPSMPYPLNYSWLSDVQAIATAIDADYQASKRNRKYFYNNASVNGVLETEKSLTQADADKIVEKWDQKYRGVDNAHKVGVLSGWLKYKPVNPSQKEMDFVESRRFNRDEIMWFFRVPKAIIGLWEGNDALNVRSFQQIFARETVKPIATRIAEAFNAELFEAWRFEFVNIVPSDLDATRNDFLSNWITLNEFRATRNLPSVEGGDKLRSAFLMSEEVLTMQNLEKQLELPSIKNIDLKLHNTMKEMISKSIKRNFKWNIEYNEKYRETKDKRISSFEKKYKAKLEFVFEKQENLILAEYKKRYSKKSIKATLPLLNIAKRSLMYYEVLKETQTDLVTVEAEKALIEVWLSDPFKVTALIEKDLRKNIEKFAGSIDTETNVKLEQTFTAILDQWLSVDDGVKLLKNDFVDLKTTRAEKIVRTETVRAWNLWSELWRKQSGVVDKKERYTSVDERVCPYCDQMHGKITEIGWTYVKEGDTLNGWSEGTLTIWYGDVNFPPLHPNCRCVLLPVVE